MTTKTKKKVTGKSLKVTIPAIKMGRMSLRLQSTSLLVMHCQTAKMRKEMLDAKMQVKDKMRLPCNPHRESLEAGYYMEHYDWLKPVADYESDQRDKGFLEEVDAAVYEGMNQIKAGEVRWGIPATALKCAACRAAKGMEKLDIKTCRGLIYVQGEWSEYNQMELVEIKIDKPPTMVEHCVTLPNGGKKDLRYRPSFESWTAEICVDFLADYLDPSSIANLFNRGGTISGVLEGRPEKSALGWGRFRVMTG